MTLLVGSIAMGLILAFLAMGMLISFRVIAFRDLTVDGSITLGGSVAAVLIVGGVDPWIATFAACLAGAAAGAVTGILATRCGINGLLSGILVMTALYSVNLRIMGRANLPLPQHSVVEQAARLADPNVRWNLGRWELAPSDFYVVLLFLFIVIAAGVVLHVFLRTNLGLALRAVGDNDQMIRALGVDVGWMTTLGLAIANGLVAFAGALLVQYQGFADVQMGIGMVVLGLASVIIGETLIGSRQIGLLIVGAVMGSVLFRLFVAISLRWGLNANDLKLVTALFVFAALMFPSFAEKLKIRKAAA